MSFSVTEPAGLRADVATSIRKGDHHKMGEHTLLDLSREFAADLVERIGTPESRVACQIAGHHVTTGPEPGVNMSGSVNVYAYVVPPDAEKAPVSQEPPKADSVPQTETQIEDQHDAAFAANGRDGDVLGG